MLLQTSDVKIKKISDKDGIGVFEFSPLPAGFGRTLGSSLRRVLLTSLTGSAVTEIRIPKVTHQFSTISGVKEDVVEISLNLKLLKTKMHSDTPIVGKIKKTGKGPVTAKDIEISSEVEIINKDLHIAQLSDKNSKFEVDITIENGVGYSPVEKRKSSKVGVILLDALFSPVVHVSYEVVSTRKGEETGLDKLVITVKTDGSVNAEDAVIEAATLLRNFFSRFAKGPDPEEIEVEPSAEASVILDENAQDEVLIEDLSLPTRTVNALQKADIKTLGELAKLTPEDLSDIKNLGDKSVTEIKKLLASEGVGTE